MEEVKQYHRDFKMKDYSVLGGGCNYSLLEEVGICETWKWVGNSIRKEWYMQKQEECIET